MTTSQRMSAAAFRARLAEKPSRGRKKAEVGGNKFGAQRTTRHGITFDSKWEADRYDQLLMLERAEAIRELRRQVRIPLIGADGQPLKSDKGNCLHYVADASYIETNTGLTVIEDAKGHQTKEYKLKKAILRAQGVEIMEVRSR